jgi:hypothetical protein
MLSKEQYYTSTPLCAFTERLWHSFQTSQYVVSVLKCQQVTALKLTNNKHNSTEIHYWLLLSHWTMRVTKMITEYCKYANLSTYSAPLHWPEARIHKPALTVHLSVAVSLSLSLWTSTNYYGCHHPSLKFVRSAFDFWYNVFGYNDVWAI